MKICPKCSREVNEIAKRCRFCGSRLSEEEKNTKQEVAQSGNASGTSRKAHVKIPLFFGLTLATALAAWAVLWFYNQQKTVKETGTQSSKAPASQPLASPSAAPKTPQTKPDEEPNYISVGGEVIPNPKKQGAVPSAGALTAQAPQSATQEEPNYISVNGRVIPNPNKKRS